MHRRTVGTATAVAAATLLTLAGVAGSRVLSAQAAAKGTMQSAPAAATPAAKPMAAPTLAGGIRGILAYEIGDAQKKLTSLAEATPADKFSWRPGTGVRSVGEVYMHVASANYFLPTFWGATPAAGVDPRTLEKDGGDKAKTIAALNASFDYLKQAINSVSDADLSKPIKMFGRDATAVGAMMVAAAHAHEHLGQSIAYARTNSIVPPWSANPSAND
jgi:uncharacterized damage-inducible protein DinB